MTFKMYNYLRYLRFSYHELIFVSTTDAKLWTYALDCIPINPDYDSSGDFLNSVDGNSRNCHCVLDHDAFFKSSLKLSRSSSGKLYVI